MRWRGLAEPPRPVRATRPSTLRVYQFRHQRVDGRIVAATGRLTPSEALATLYEQTFDQEGGRCSRSVSARFMSLCSATWIRTGIRPPCARSERRWTGVAVDRARPSGQPRAITSAPRPDESRGRSSGTRRERPAAGATVSVADVGEVRVLPLVGEIAAGGPLLSEENVEEHLAVPDTLSRGARSSCSASRATA